MAQVLKAAPQVVTVTAGGASTTTRAWTANETKPQGALCSLLQRHKHVTAHEDYYVHLRLVGREWICEIALAAAYRHNVYIMYDIYVCEIYMYMTYALDIYVYKYKYTYI